MAVVAGQGSDFGATLEDNGNPIGLPSGSTFAWSTDDPTDQIVPSADTTSATITVAATNTRPSITVTASTTAPDGSNVSGSVTTEIIPGTVPHTYTVTVSQLSTVATRGKKK